MINICQTIPWAQLGDDLRLPNHNLGNVNIGYGLAVTAVTLLRLHYVLHLCYKERHSWFITTRL